MALVSFHSRPCAGALLIQLVVLLVGGLLILCVAKGLVQDRQAAQDALVLDEASEFAAIQGIHRQLDDNADGTVDFSESEEFVQTELREGSEKSQKLHQTDLEITFEDLWHSWHENEVFDWSSAEVVNWLEHYVELPQYAEMFRKYNITGRLLPRIANNTNQILQLVLQITDSQHKQKIQLRAMDVVLFGPPNGSYSYWKDVIVVLSTTVCLFGILYALRQRHYAQSRIDTFLRSIRGYEKELQELKEKLELQKEEGHDMRGSSPAAITPSSSESNSPQEVDIRSDTSYSRSSSIQESSLFRAQEVIEHLRRKVWLLETQLGASHGHRASLQSLLQQTYQREWGHLDGRKRAAEEEMTNAQKVCDKIKKQRSSLIGTLRLANSSAVEDAGLQITKAVNKMHKISESFDDYHKRWRKIEQVCNFAITYSPAPTPTRVTPRSSIGGGRTEAANGLSPWESSTSISSLVDSFGRISPAFAAGKASTLPPMPPGRQKSHSIPNANKAVYQRHSDSSQEFTTSQRQQDTHSLGAVPRRRNSHCGKHSSSPSSFSQAENHSGRTAGFHPSTSLPLIRKPSYTEAVSGSALSLDFQDLDGISFSAAATTERREKTAAKETHSDGEIKNRDWSLGAIREEAGDLEGRGGEKFVGIPNGSMEEEERERRTDYPVASGSEVKLGPPRRTASEPSRKSSPKKNCSILQSNSSLV